MKNVYFAKNKESQQIWFFGIAWSTIMNVLEKWPKMMGQCPVASEVSDEEDVKVKYVQIVFACVEKSKRKNTAQARLLS